MHGFILTADSRGKNRLARPPTTADPLRRLGGWTRMAEGEEGGFSLEKRGIGVLVGASNLLTHREDERPGDIRGVVREAGRRAAARHGGSADGEGDGRGDSAEEFVVYEGTGPRHRSDEVGQGFIASIVSEENFRTQAPDDYALLLSSASVSGELPVLIGGQAVNFWALRFVEEEPGLEEFRPFVSTDCDVLASATWLQEAARKYGFAFKAFRAGQASPAVGWIRLPAKDRPDIELQVLRDVFGLSREEVSEAVFEGTLEQGEIVRVLSPTKLLQAKVANLRRIPQEGRHDL